MEIIIESWDLSSADARILTDLIAIGGIGQAIIEPGEGLWMVKARVIYAGTEANAIRITTAGRILVTASQRFSIPDGASEEEIGLISHRAVAAFTGTTLIEEAVVAETARKITIREK